MISEAMPMGGVPDVVGATTGVPGGNIQNLVNEFEKWAKEYGAPTGALSSSVLATFLVDRGLDKDPMVNDIIKGMSQALDLTRRDIELIKQEIKLQRKEYDAGGTLSDEELYQRSFKESSMRITKKQLRNIIQETFTDVITRKAASMMEKPALEPSVQKPGYISIGDVILLKAKTGLGGKATGRVTDITVVNPEQRMTWKSEEDARQGDSVEEVPISQAKSGGVVFDYENQYGDSKWAYARQIVL